MFKRDLQLIDNESLFIFGPRGVGKTTYLKNLIFFESSLYINLLKAEEENRFSRNPDELTAIVKALPENIHHVIIDEIQKIPKLLDIVHDLIESLGEAHPVKFILTGSSARRLKAEGVNLLAGRAFVYAMFPLCITECFSEGNFIFDLDQALRFGMLPKVFEYDSELKKLKYLEAYTNTYLKEEIWAEQVIRDLAPFRYFLQVAAQMNGKEVNFLNISKDVGVSDTTVIKYYAILEDTLLGFFLPPFQHSFRKRLSKTSKFYFFDTGVVRSLVGRLSVPLEKGTSGYGEIFEHFVILQCKQLASYHRHEYRFSFLRTKDDAEIDLVVERPGAKTLLIEIKSSTNVQEENLRTLNALTEDLISSDEGYEALCFSQDSYRKQWGHVLVLPWLEGLRLYFGPENEE
jgi:predicted AAA+ superfamily ATPase